MFTLQNLIGAKRFRASRYGDRFVSSVLGRCPTRKRAWIRICAKVIDSFSICKDTAIISIGNEESSHSDLDLFKSQRIIWDKTKSIGILD